TDDKLKPATDKIGLYRVQFGSFRNFKKATQAKEKMDKKYSNLLTDVKLEVFTYTNDKAASFHRVWTTPLTKAFGLELCNKFKKQKVVCILQINN
ncbi:MAG: SPOR domain-containing protein, partial [Alphaproteobacteria bacterium]|nr:SPOR domain-containing protein [Alphaproteobacteria bacterium]